MYYLDEKKKSITWFKRAQYDSDIKSSYNSGLVNSNCIARKLILPKKKRRIYISENKKNVEKSRRVWTLSHVPNAFW